MQPRHQGREVRGDQSLDLSAQEIGVCVDPILDESQPWDVERSVYVGRTNGVSICIQSIDLISTWQMSLENNCVARKSPLREFIDNQHAVSTRVAT